MRRARVVETRRDRMELAQRAGVGSLSIMSVIAGMFSAFGCFAVLAAVAGFILRGFGVDSPDDLSRDATEVGMATGVALVAVLLHSYLFGGYVAGRMARRGGILHGV